MTIKKESWYKVQKSDSLSLIAKAASVVDWRIIYNHPENSSFRKDNPNPDMIKPGSMLWIPLEIRKTTGATLINLEKIRDAICVADAHMHIQSGHVGTLPFALGAVVCDYRKMVLDIPTSKLLENLDRNLLDNYAEFYEKKKWFIKKWIIDPKPIHATSDALVKVVADGTAFVIDAVNVMLSSKSDVRDFAAEKTISALNQYVEIVRNASEINEELAQKLNNLRSQIIDKNALHIISSLNLMMGYYVFLISKYSEKTVEISAAVLEELLEQQKKICENIINIIDTVVEIDNKVIDVFYRRITQIFADVSNTTINNLVKINPYLYLEKFSGLLFNLAGNYSEFFAIQKKKTYEIAALAVDGNEVSLYAKSVQSGISSNKIFAPIIALPMDLDFAHIDRFEDDDEKSVVYRYANKRYRISKRWFRPETDENELELWRKMHLLIEETGDYYYFHSRISGKKNGKLVWVHPEEYKLYEKWDVQLDDSIISALQNPWRIIPLYHFEPRRYSGNCEDAFQYVMHKSSKAYSEGKKYRLFAGIKVYPNLGYKPLDPRLPSLNVLYQRCVENDIPIMTHGSPQGAFTHDRPFYYEYDVEKNVKPISEQSDINYNVKSKSAKDANYYFMQEYASPYAWEKVLEKYPDLRLCIAHFGGSDKKPTNKEALSGWNKPINVQEATKGQWDTSVWNQKIISMIQTYKNLYTDISCHDVKNLLPILPCAIEAWPDLRKRIMFGTDWYMTEIQGFSYEEFIDQMKDGIYKIDAQVRNSGALPRKDPHLWEWFTEINPFRFYRFDRIAHEYTKELVRGIKEKDNSMINSKQKEVKENFTLHQEYVIYKVAKRLIEMGELPNDAKTCPQVS